MRDPACRELKQQGMEQSGSVLYWSIDIQGFKAVNDNISHEVGDEALAAYGQLLPRKIEECKTKWTKRSQQNFVSGRPRTHGAHRYYL